MNPRFKDYSEGFDIHNEDLHYPAEPTRKEKAMIFGMLLFPLVLIVGAAFAQAH